MHKTITPDKPIQHKPKIPHLSPFQPKFIDNYYQKPYEILNKPYETIYKGDNYYQIKSYRKGRDKNPSMH